MKEKLGEGSYGKVLLAKHRVNGNEIAVKSILKKRIKKQENLKREIKIMKDTNHPSIISLYQVYEDKAYLYITMEVCSGGELFDYIQKMKSFSEIEAAILLHQILGAVAYLHEKDIAHRDLKPENFLFKEKNNIKSLKMIDFGLSRYYSTEQQMNTRVGTTYYIAPEVLKAKKNYNNSCDLWSFGVIMYILLCGYPPFWGSTESQIFKRVKKANFNFPSKFLIFLS